jgi:hypothetical protein
MSTITTLQLAVGALTLLTNAFFVGAEFALISVRRSQIEPRAQEGDKRARMTLWGLRHISAMMATAQLGITVSSLVLGAVAEPAIAHLLEPAFEVASVPDALVHPVAFVIALTVATYLHMLIGEMIPKNLALAAPVPAALLLGPPLVALTRALKPVVFGINAFANALLKLLRVEAKGEVESVFTDDQLARMVVDSSQAGLLLAADGERLRDALELGTRPVGEILVPAQRMRTVEHTVTPAQLERAAAEAGFSRFPVTGEDGTLLGYLHIKDTLGVADRDRPFPRSALHAVTRVRIDTPLDDVSDEGRRIAGRYTLTEQIGRGGMGTVWRADDEVLGRQVAIKRLHARPELSADELATLFERTRREARSAARIAHPNVIVVHDVVDDDGRPCIVMEYVPGSTLADLLKDGRTLPYQEAARIGLGHGRRPARGPRRRCAAPRRQARQRPARRRRPDRPHRLRHRRDGRDVDADQDRRDGRLHPLHGAGADPRAHPRNRLRPVGPGRHALPGRRGTPAVPPGHRDGDRVRHRHGPDGTHEAGRTRWSRSSRRS